MGFTNPGLQRTPLLKVIPGEQEILAGNWPLATLAASVWSFTLLPSSPSGAAYAGYRGLFTQEHGALWLVNSALELYATAADLLAFSLPLTWAAGQLVSITMNVPIKKVTIAGAATGNGTFTWAQVGPYFDAAWSGGRLYTGGFQPPNPGYLFAGTVGNVYG